MKKSTRRAPSQDPPRRRSGARMRARKQATQAKPGAAWFLYVLRCSDGALYCGIAVDVEKRLAQHRSGRGARYTRGRGPLSLARVWELENRSSALRAEWAFKKLSRAKKEKILAGAPAAFLTAQV